MRFSGYCTLVIAITVAGFAIAQPANPVDNHTSCIAEKADVEKRMEVARSKGQMLLRRQLADQLAALQSSCQPLAVDKGHTANIERLEKEVRALRAEPEHGFVVEVAFEGIARSNRHKSGVAMRFPRIARLRQDKLPKDADRLETLVAML